jgi:hypothetical protein
MLYNIIDYVLLQIGSQIFDKTVFSVRMGQNGLTLLIKWEIIVHVSSKMG